MNLFTSSKTHQTGERAELVWDAVGQTRCCFFMMARFEGDPLGHQPTERLNPLASPMMERETSKAS